MNRRADSVMCKQLSDFSLNAGPRTDQSYTVVPAEFPKSFYMGADEICKKVLNLTWVSVPTGSEHFSFHLKNNFEEQLFKCEDERYEYDMYVRMMDSTLNSLRNLDTLVKQNPNN